MDKTRESSNLDFLRASAVSLVLIAHLGIFFGYADRPGFNVRALGVLGVLFFFVHTSLVLMFSLQRQDRKFGAHARFLTFVVRRIFRIYPLALVALGFIVAFHLPSSSLKVHSLAYSAPDKLTLLSNALLAQNLVNRPSILGVMWSLPYEMQMYVFLPALFLFARKLKTILPLALLWVAAAILAVAQPHLHKVPDFFWYVPCFLPGILAFRLSADRRPSVPFAVMPLVLLVLAVAYTWHFPSGHEFDLVSQHNAVMRGMFVCLCIGLSLPFFVEVKSPAVRRVAHLIAKYSYGIYIAHYFCIWASFMALRNLPMAFQWLAFAALLVAVPAALFHGIENPGIQAGGRVAEALFGHRRRALAAREAEKAAA
ncbi:MAG TPA: acyltransferase [Armatimonadota bacterium]